MSVGVADIERVVAKMARVPVQAVSSDDRVSLQRLDAELRSVIFGQDQRIVESQRPEQVPFDLADELHLKFDAVAVAYRRAMKTQGLG